MSCFIWRMSHRGAGLSNRSWNRVTDGLSASSSEKTPGSWLCVTEWCVKSFIVLSQCSWTIAPHPVSHLDLAQAAHTSPCSPAGMGQGLPKKQRGLVIELPVRGVSSASFRGCFQKVVPGFPISAGFSFPLLWLPLLSMFYFLLLLFVVVSKELVSWFQV